MNKKINYIKQLIATSKTEKDTLKKIMSFHENIEGYPDTELSRENLVEGCQSELYLAHKFENEKIKFYIHSEAMISKGLASILVYVYSNESPKKIFTTPPIFLSEIDAIKKLSLNRQLGISNLFKKMQLLASKYI